MKAILSMLFISFFFVSCTKDRLTADGNITTEIRTLGAFNEVRSSGSTNIHIIYGTEYKVELRGSANLLPRYETRVHNNVLDLGYERVNVQNDDIEIYVTMPIVSAVSLSGSGNLIISGNFPDQDYFRLSISGSAEVEVLDTFNADNVVVNISGSGDANLQKVISKHSDVKVSGSGNVSVTAIESLKVTISGSGKVFYLGNPVISSSISGSGKVVKL